MHHVSKQFHTTALLVTGIIAAQVLVAAPREYAHGKLVDVERKHGAYYYRIIAGEDGYVGRSRHHYHVQLGPVRFIVHEHTMYFLDDRGKERTARYLMQELLPPPPPPPLPVQPTP
jgi:hypothetical protein